LFFLAFCGFTPFLGVFGWKRNHNKVGEENWGWECSNSCCSVWFLLSGSFFKYFSKDLKGLSGFGPSYCVCIVPICKVYSLNPIWKYSKLVWFIFWCFLFAFFHQI
jgi:hypothetical protein